MLLLKFDNKLKLIVLSFPVYDFFLTYFLFSKEQKTVASQGSFALH